MKEIKTKKGILKYRMPNIIEAYDILEASGVGSGETSTLKLKRNIISVLAPFVDFSDLKDVNSFDDLLSDVENMIHPLSEIADEIIAKSFVAFKKKN